MPPMMGLTRDQDEMRQTAEKAGLGDFFDLYMIVQRHRHVFHRLGLLHPEGRQLDAEITAFLNRSRFNPKENPLSHEKCTAMGASPQVMASANVAGVSPATLFELFQILQAAIPVAEEAWAKAQEVIALFHKNPPAPPAV